MTKEPKMVTIQCVECGAPRLVKTQDAHQVKRCVDCQHKMRIHRRRELHKQEKSK